MKLKYKLMLAFSLILLVFSTLVFTVAYSRITAIVNETFTRNIEAGAALGLEIIDTKYPGKWQVKEGKLYKGEKLINENYEVVNTIKERTGYLATIFLEDTRVSTNVVQSDGKPAIGSKASPEIREEVLAQGEDHSGPAKINGMDAITHYSPITDSSGNRIGMWFVGIETSRVKEQINHTLLQLGGVMAAMLLLGMLLSYYLAVKMSKAVKAVGIQLETMSEGDFSREIPRSYMKLKDEIGDMVRSAEKMQQSVRNMIRSVIAETREIDKAVSTTLNQIEELNANIEEVSATTQQLSAGMEETAASTEEMNATAEDIESAVGNIAAKAREGAETAREINKRALELSLKAGESHAHAHEIYSKTNERVKAAIKRTEAVEEIHVLTETILQLASQTNLLALNAAIEAARAGEAGRGFSVVAEEIRKLADDSKQTVNRIQAVTKSISQSVGNLVESSREVLEFIDHQVIRDYEMFVETGKQYGEDSGFMDNLVTNFDATSQQLLTSINSMVKVIGEVAIAANEGAGGTSSIADAIADITDQSNNVAQMADKLSKTSDMLKQNIDRFKV